MYSRSSQPRGGRRLALIIGAAAGDPSQFYSHRELTFCCLDETLWALPSSMSVVAELALPVGAPLCAGTSCRPCPNIGVLSNDLDRWVGRSVVLRKENEGLRDPAPPSLCNSVACFVPHAINHGELRLAPGPGKELQDYHLPHEC